MAYNDIATFKNHILQSKHWRNIDKARAFGFRMIDFSSVL